MSKKIAVNKSTSSSTPVTGKIARRDKFFPDGKESILGLDTYEKLVIHFISIITYLIVIYIFIRGS